MTTETTYSPIHSYADIQRTKADAAKTFRRNCWCAGIVGWCILALVFCR